MAMFDKRSPEPDRKPAPPTQKHAAAIPTPVSTKSGPSTGKRAAVGVTAVVGESISLKGDLSGGENILIQGQVEGSINIPSHTVEVGDTGRVKAQVAANIIQVDGTVEGDLIGGELVTINENGVMTGNITAPRVVLEDGSKFVGRIDMGGKAGAATSVKATKDPAAKPSTKANTATQKQASAVKGTPVGRVTPPPSKQQ